MTLHRISFVLALCLLPATQGVALSCVALTPRDAVANLAQQGQTARVVVGSLRFAHLFEGLRKDTEALATPQQMDNTTVRILGEDLATGEEVDFVADVVRSCAGMWCGATQDNDHALVILRADAPVAVGPCGGDVFASPSRKDIRKIRACLANATCADQ